MERMNPKDLWGTERCGICGERFGGIHAEVGEFVQVDEDAGFGGQDITRHVIAHAQCGLDAGLELA